MKILLDLFKKKRFIYELVAISLVIILTTIVLTFLKLGLTLTLLISLPIFLLTLVCIFFSGSGINYFLDMISLKDKYIIEYDNNIYILTLDNINVYLNIPYKPRVSLIRIDPNITNISNIDDLDLQTCIRKIKEEVNKNEKEKCTKYLKID